MLFTIRELVIVADVDVAKCPRLLHTIIVACYKRQMVSWLAAIIAATVCWWIKMVSTVITVVKLLMAVYVAVGCIDGACLYSLTRWGVIAACHLNDWSTDVCCCWWQCQRCLCWYLASCGRVCVNEMVSVVITGLTCTRWTFSCRPAVIDCCCCVTVLLLCFVLWSVVVCESIQQFLSDSCRWM